MAAVPRSHEFFIALESLRGIAALSVVLCHIPWAFPFHDIGLIKNGRLMVDLFFVLSGFVICHSYGSRIETGRDVAKFVWIRLGRLYPLHLLLLFVFLGIEIAKYVAETHFGFITTGQAFTSNNTASLISNLLLIQGLGLHDTVTYNMPAWSISTEFYTYIVFAAVLLLSKTRAVLVSVSGLLIVASMALDSGKLDHNLFSCVEGFFAGVITFHCYRALSTRQDPQSARKWPMDLPGILSFAGLMAFLSMVDMDSSEDGRGFDLLILPLVAALILSIVLTPKGLLSTILEMAPLAWVGKVSYSIYMVHMAIIWPFTLALKIGLKTPQIIDGNGATLLNSHPLTGLLFLMATIVGILVTSRATYTYIEDRYRRKSRALAEKWFPASATDCTEQMGSGMRTDLSGNLVLLNGSHPSERGTPNATSVPHRHTDFHQAA